MLYEAREARDISCVFIMFKMSLSLLLLYSIFCRSISLKIKHNDVFSSWQIGQKSPERNIGPLADSIKCKRDIGHEHFTALVTLPGGFNAIPVFHEAAHLNPTASTDCIMKQVSKSSTFKMDIMDFDKCGVQIQRANDGAEWMAVTLRFPFVTGLRMAEDEYVTIMCKPQDRTAVKNHALDLRSSAYNPPKTIFSSAPLEFDCDIDLFMKPEGGNSYTQELPSNGIIEIGQELQLRATVRSGDGWNYALLRDVVIHKVSKPPVISNSVPNSRKRISGIKRTMPTKFVAQSTKSKRDVIDRDIQHHIPDAAYLIYSDGCRNSAYRSVASQQPFRDSNDNLVVKFNFKAFMFQDMTDGDTIRITAKVVACVDKIDCEPTRCQDDDQAGYGRKRRAIDYESLRNGTNKLGDFEREFDITVVAPGYAKATIKSESGTFSEVPHNSEEEKCRLIVYLISSLALMFCLSTAIATAVAVKARKDKFIFY